MIYQNLEAKRENRLPFINIRKSRANQPSEFEKSVNWSSKTNKKSKKKSKTTTTNERR